MSIKPVYINLFKIQLPLSALLSISHRVSGILIFFLVLPVSAYILNLLLASQDSFSSFVDVFNSSVFLRTFVLFNILIFEYHVIAGIRHMLMDFKLVSETLSASNTSAITALIVGKLIWYLQRYSAIYFLLFLGYLGLIVFTDRLSFQFISESFTFKLSLSFFIVLACMHAFAGLWTIGTDYLTNRTLGFISTSLSTYAFSLFFIF